ncbi:MAG TPA: peptidylprolyl isomerase [Bryobacteraceae bacterium]
MFDVFRSREKSVRILLGALLLVVAASMLVYLIPGGVGGPGGGNDNVVASVGKEAITASDVQREIQRITRGQANLPKGLIAMYIPSIVNQLVEQKALAYKAREMGLSISDDELISTIQSTFAAQMGGKFDMQIYRGFLAQQGLTDRAFEEQEREAMLVTRLESIEKQSLIVSDEAARAEYQRKNLKIGLAYLKFEGKDFLAKVNKDPAAVKAYFDKNRAQFRIPEKRDVELVAGTVADFMQKVQISDAELQKQYQESLDSFRTPERVRVRHILIKTQGKPKEEAPKLKAKAEDLLKQLKAGADFADLAKKNSEDTGSAEKGGELGWIVKGQTVPNFEKAAFSLQPGTLSGIIETEYGYHILQVEEKQAAHTQSLEEAKPQLLAEAKKQMASDNLSKAIEAAHNEALRAPTQEAAIAAKYGLKYFKADNLTTNTPLPEMNGVPELTNAIFAAAKGGTTDVVNVDAQGKAGFATVSKIVPARNAEYAEVQGEVMQRYVTAESDRLAEEAAKQAAERARKGENLEALGKAYGLTVKTAAPFTIDGAAEGIGAATQLSAAFEAKQGGIVGPIAAQGGQFVCKVSEKMPADMSQYASNKAAIVESLEQQKLQMQQPLFRDSVVQDLKRRGKVKINEAAIRRIAGSFEG